MAFLLLVTGDGLGDDEGDDGKWRLACPFDRLQGRARGLSVRGKRRRQCEGTQCRKGEEKATWSAMTRLKESESRQPPSRPSVMTMALESIALGMIT